MSDKLNIKVSHTLLPGKPLAGLSSECSEAVSAAVKGMLEGGVKINELQQATSHKSAVQEEISLNSGLSCRVTGQHILQEAQANKSSGGRGA